MENNRLRSADLTGAAWAKSSYSGGGNGDCIETTAISSGPEKLGVGVRDSKDPQGGILRFSPESWASFVEFAANSTVN
jgi:hypothetical protein